MALNKKIKVEVAYATPQLQHIIAIQVDEGCTIEDAIYSSGILTLFPEINLDEQKVGLFSKQKKLTDTVQLNDRVEIYRSLIMNPKEARKQRALHALSKKI